MEQRCRSNLAVSHAARACSTCPLHIPLHHPAALRCLRTPRRAAAELAAQRQQPPQQPQQPPPGLLGGGDPLASVARVASAYEAEQGFRELPPAELAAALGAGLVQLVLDVRSEAEFEAGACLQCPMLV